MNRYTLEEYLELQDTLDYRSEFHDGSVLPVEAATLTHARLEARIGGILDKSFLNGCATFGSSLNLYIPAVNKIVHPDATVICGQANHPRQDCIDNPAILVEITSPSTKDYDYGTKREYYFSLPSVRHYLLVSQSEAVVGHYARSGVAWIYVDRGRDETILLGDIELSVSDIYSGIVTPGTAP